MKGMIPHLGSLLTGLCVVFPPFSPLSVLIFRVVDQTKTSAHLLASVDMI